MAPDMNTMEFGGMKIDAMSLITLGASLLWKMMNNELVQRAISNFVNGTKNKWDDMVWEALQKVLLLRLPPDMAVVKLNTELASIQAAYDATDPEKKWEMKKPRMAWSSDSDGRFVFNA